MKFYPPKHKQTRFHCPYCQVFASQRWGEVFTREYSSYSQMDEFSTSRCAHCGDVCFWKGELMIVPSDVPVPPAHEDLPEDCKQDYEEAREIFSRSPRAAAALLRLCVQKLLVDLGGDGKNINADIKRLVEKGLPVLIQQALDYCRVVGNNAVHPGEINLNDSPETASICFDMVNLIVEDQITRPKQIEAAYSKLPEPAREAIEKRDSSSPTS